MGFRWVTGLAPGESCVEMVLERAQHWKGHNRQRQVKQRGLQGSQDEHGAWKQVS